MKTYLNEDEIYCLDCIKFLNKIRPQSIDLAILDPPYNMNKADWDTFDSFDCFLNFTKRWIKALIPALKNTASIYIFNTPYNCSYILHDLLKYDLIFQNWITWDKRDGLGTSTKKYANGQETILFLTKGPGHTFNADEIRIPYESTERIAHATKKGILKNGKRWFPNEHGKLCGEVWHFPSARHSNKINGKLQKQAHITQKPIELIERIIKASSNKGDLVLDCFVGSGTTAVAAQKLNRHFICADKSEVYVNIAKNRLISKEEL